MSADSSSGDGFTMWPVTDTQIDKDELEAMDGVDIGSVGTLTGPGVSIGSVSAYGSYHSGPMAIDSVDRDTITVKGNMTISDLDGNNTVDVGASIRAINERLLVLTPNFEAMEKYPALKDAYDQYKMLEKLLMESDSENKNK